MLLNMVMFKVTICDIGKMNINMTDKIEKRRQPLQYRTMAMTTTIMSMVRASAAMTAAWKLRRHELCRELQRITSKRVTHTRRCSSTTTQTIWVVVVTSPTLTARWSAYRVCSFRRSVRWGAQQHLEYTLVISIWGNLAQWREYQAWEVADLKYRALKMVLPSDDPNVRYIEKHFSVCRDEKVIDDVRNCVAAYEDSIRHHHEMVEMATYKDSIANKLLQESNRIKRAMESSK